MQVSQPPSDDALELFYAHCGVSVHLHEAPQNRFQEIVPDDQVPSAAEPPRHGLSRSPPPGGDPPRAIPVTANEPSRSPVPPQPVARPAATPLTDLTGDADIDSVGDAREAARHAATLEALHEAVRSFSGCPLKATARQACVGEGALAAPLMFVGEAPGREEDAKGRPFVGRSGQLLERMIAAIGLQRGEVYISNVIPWRPPANRTPTPIETATCEVFIRREIALVRPKIVVPLGGPAAKLLLRTNEGIVRQRGRWTLYEDEGVSLPALPTFHPAYLLRTPAEKRRTWQDLLALRARLEEAHGLPPLR